MDILKQNTDPVFTIVPRYDLDELALYRIDLKNEMSQKTESIDCTLELKPNENAVLMLESFPAGKIGDKFSYSLIETVADKVVCLGRLMIVSETENIQDYSKKSNNKFYS